MSKTVIFGGTTEGRKLCGETAGPVVYCVATQDGARPVEALPHVDTRVGRLNAAEMAAMLERESPALVIDATHPYAEEASRNIAAACEMTAIPLKRVARESAREPGCLYFGDMPALLHWLETTQGNVFVTAGVSAAAPLAGLKERIWLRVLPSMESLRVCLGTGYGPERIICMQGPFSETLNRAMFEAADARILVTKESGQEGGFPEKARAAKALGMKIAVLERPVKP
jgi:precorrin-6x reductase